MDFIKSMVFYIFNIIIFIYFILLIKEYNTVLFKNIYIGTIISILLQFVLFYGSGGFQGIRNTGSFNNPNQLGYYGLISFGLMILLSQRIKVNIKIFTLSVFSATILALSSLSKASILSFLGTGFFYLISTNQNKKLKRNLIVLLIFLSLSILYIKTYYPSFITDNSLYTAVQNRLNAIGKDNDDNLKGRGYDRIFEYPEYWIFGAGEGGYYRFYFKPMEFHSTLGNLQVSYGIIGLLLFWSILFMVLKKNMYKSWYIIIFILVYGLTHNGIRNSLFWILLSVIAMSTFRQDNIKIQNSGGKND